MRSAKSPRGATDSSPSPPLHAPRRWSRCCSRAAGAAAEFLTADRGNAAVMAEAKTTTDHEEIRRWAESRGGRPAHVRETGNGGDAGILRINFEEPGGDDDEGLAEISWDEWFRAFDENGLAFL